MQNIFIIRTFVVIFSMACTQFAGAACQPDALAVDFLQYTGKRTKIDSSYYYQPLKIDRDACDTAQKVPPHYAMCFTGMQKERVRLMVVPSGCGDVEVSMKDIVDPRLYPSVLRTVEYTSGGKENFVIVFANDCSKCLWSMHYSGGDCCAQEIQHEHFLKYDDNGTLQYCAPCCPHISREVFKNAQLLERDGTQVCFSVNGMRCVVKAFVRCKFIEILSEIPNTHGGVDVHQLDYVEGGDVLRHCQFDSVSAEHFFKQHLPSLTAYEEPNVLCKNTGDTLLVDVQYVRKAQPDQRFGILYNSVSESISMNFFKGDKRLYSLGGPALQWGEEDVNLQSYALSLFDQRMDKTTMLFSSPGCLSCVKGSTNNMYQMLNVCSTARKASSDLILHNTLGLTLFLSGIWRFPMALEYDSSKCCMLSKFYNDIHSKFYSILSIPSFKKFQSSTVNYTFDPRAPIPRLTRIIDAKGVDMNLGACTFSVRCAAWHLEVRVIQKASDSKDLVRYTFSIKYAKDSFSYVEGRGSYTGQVVMRHGDISRENIKLSATLRKNNMQIKGPDSMRLDSHPNFGFFSQQYRCYDYNVFLTLSLGQEKWVVWSIIPREGFWGLDIYTKAQRTPLMNFLDYLDEKDAEHLKVWL